MRTLDAIDALIMSILILFIVIIMCVLINDQQKQLTRTAVKLDATILMFDKKIEGLKNERHIHMVPQRSDSIKNRE